MPMKTPMTTMNKSSATANQFWAFACSATRLGITGLPSLLTERLQKMPELIECQANVCFPPFPTIFINPLLI